MFVTYPPDVDLGVLKFDLVAELIKDFMVWYHRPWLQEARLDHTQNDPEVMTEAAMTF